MPLPPALLARLKKRGIVKGRDQPEEEIIAESYDDDSVVTSIVGHGHLVKTGSGGPNIAACPNRSNPFHNCTPFCRDKWGGGGTGVGYDDPKLLEKPRKPEKIRLDPEMERRRKRMLRKYPLPGGWEEVLDRNSSRYYYWNTATDQVCWLSPTHPRCILTLSASKMKNVRADRLPPPTKPVEVRQKPRRSPPPSSYSGAEDQIDMGLGGEPPGKKGRREAERAVVKSNDLDPMDPAAYSEAPRGTWASGLETEDDAVTGVDVTASGPLFQMRPYPAPGAILKKNSKPPEKPKDKNARPIGPTM